MQILTNSTHPTLAFAKEELSAYLTRMGRPEITYQLEVLPLKELMERIPELSAEKAASVKDPSLDDLYYIDVAKEGLIAGINPRSVLLGVYKYLTLIGCAFLRPGHQNEVVPTYTDKACFFAHELTIPTLRHRGACIEGADSVEHILDFIDWSPKIGFNSFFLQFEYPHIFLERWYKHEDNPYLKPVPWSLQDSARVMPGFLEAMEKRGLLSHLVGHGWTSKVLGCPEIGWDSVGERSFTPEVRELIAEVKGKRELYYGVPANTNLCLSNPRAIEAFSDQVIQYVQDNPKTDYLHIWLADDVNNSCECENCRKMRPSDYYIRLLNRIDERLEAIGSKTRLVLLMYVDLLWAPEVERLNHPDRFVLMFAPISRTFEHSYDEYQPEENTPPYVRNQLSFPRDLPTNLGFLQQWQRAVQTDSFVYDYYMGRAHYGDPTYVGISRLIARDLKHNQALGLNGISSCQELRSSFPNGLANQVMARFSEDPSLDFDTFAKGYYRACYGPAGDEVFEVLSQIADCFSPDYILSIGPKINPELHERLARVPALLDQVQELIDTCTADPEKGASSCEAQRHMWEELQDFVTYTDLLADILQASCEGASDKANELFDTAYMDFIAQHEVKDSIGLDAFRVSHIIRGAIRKNRPEFPYSENPL